MSTVSASIFDNVIVDKCGVAVDWARIPKSTMQQTAITEIALNIVLLISDYFS